MLRFFSFRRFCTQILKQRKNSINPVSEHIAFGHYFPKEWSQDFIYSQLDPGRRMLSHVQLVLNRLGQPSGKVLLKFNNADAMRKCVQQYNEDFIVTKQSTHRVIIKPFQLKTKQISRRTTIRKTKHEVKVKNLDFDITVQELQRLAKDFGTVEHIEMHVRPNGLNNGLASIYFNKRGQADDFAYFCDGLLYKERKLKAQIVQVKSEIKKTENYLKQPKITLLSHEYVYKKFMILQGKSNQKQQEKN